MCVNTQTPVTSKTFARKCSCSDIAAYEIHTAFQVSYCLQSAPACPGPWNDFSDSWLVQSAHVSHQISLDNAHRHKPITQPIHLTLQRKKHLSHLNSSKTLSIHNSHILHHSSCSEHTLGSWHSNQHHQAPLTSIVSCSWRKSQHKACVELLEDFFPLLELFCSHFVVLSAIYNMFHRSSWWGPD